jgi:hypothetical protein
MDYEVVVLGANEPIEKVPTPGKMLKLGVAKRFLDPRSSL